STADFTKAVRGIQMTPIRGQQRSDCHKQNTHSASSAWGGAIALIAGLMLTCAAHAQSYSAEAMWQLQRLGEPDISPDGRLAVVPVTRHDIDKNKGDTDLWLVPTKPGKA